jgi:hypothetical protein
MRPNEKATRQLRRPFLQGRNVLTEVFQTVKTFWRNLMGRKRGVSRNFCEISLFVFNYLGNRLTTLLCTSF